MPLFQTSHSSEDVKPNPLLSIEALNAMKNMKPDKKGIQRVFQEMNKCPFCKNLQNNFITKSK